MARQTTLTVRLTEEEAELLDELARLRGSASRSEAIREMIRQSSEDSGLDKEITPHQDQKEPVTIMLPSKFTADIDFLVGIDYHQNRNEALYTAIKTYLYENIDLWKIKKRAEDMKEIELIVAEDGTQHLR